MLYDEKLVLDVITVHGRPYWPCHINRTKTDITDNFFCININHWISIIREVVLEMTDYFILMTM